MISLMTTETSNSIESLLRLPFNIMLFQYKLVEERLKAQLEARNRHRIQY